MEVQASLLPCGLPGGHIQVGLQAFAGASRRTHTAGQSSRVEERGGDG